MSRVIIIGSGAAGLAAAWSLRDAATVTVFEAAQGAGGHADTVDVETVDAGSVPVDMGFIVYNDQTYPHLIRWFDELSVPTAPSDMSFARSDSGYEYAGSGRGLLGGTNWARPSTWRLLRDILRFREVARANLDDDRTIGRFVEEHGFSREFRERYLLPMAAAIWSSPHVDAAAIPAGTLLRFFDQHQLLDLTGRPTWRTVEGGSREYVRRALAASGAELRTGRAVVGVRRLGAVIEIVTADGARYEADHVVLACHADTSLALLADGASSGERRLLGCFGFSRNRAVMHSDPSLMPRRRRLWSAWNVMGGPGDGPLTVTYWMNRLQPLATGQEVFVTLNPPIEPSVVHRVTNYSHPMFTPEAVSAQLELPSIQGVDGVWFCGAWTGYGFHEDAVESGFAVGRALGGDVPWWDDVTPHSVSARIADGVPA